MMRTVVTIFGICTIAALGVRAQEPAPAKVLAEQAATLKAKLELQRVAVESRMTKNAPYSAEAVTESVQQLADGNRIVTKNTTRVYRDGESRTRREQLNQAGTDIVNITLSDPVAGTTYILDPETHTAFRNGFIITTPTGVAAGTFAAHGRGSVRVFGSPDGAVTVSSADLEKEAAHKKAAESAASGEVRMRRSPDGFAGTFVAAGDLPANVIAVGAETKREELGQQTLEGVTVTGTRTTTEIPAGAIGNEQPLKIVSEQWYSPELQVLVLTKHSDPRNGDTTYRLTGIVRAEPARSLFDLPPDYTLKESVIRRQE
jgi:hypothetical protein